MEQGIDVVNIIDLGVLEFEDMVDPVQSVFDEFEKHWIEPFDRIIGTGDSDLQLIMIADLFIKNGSYPMEMKPLSDEIVLSIGDIPSRLGYYFSLQYDSMKKMEHWNAICSAYSVASSVFDSRVVKALLEARAASYK